MKYPLKVVIVLGQQWNVAITDDTGKFICHVMDKEWGNTFAHFIVKAANRWHRLRPWFRSYTRNDWFGERS